MLITYRVHRDFLGFRHFEDHWALLVPSWAQDVLAILSKVGIRNPSDKEPCRWWAVRKGPLRRDLEVNLGFLWGISWGISWWLNGGWMGFHKGFHKGFTSVNVETTMESHHATTGKAHYCYMLWPFSIAVLNYQRAWYSDWHGLLDCFVRSCATFIELPMIFGIVLILISDWCSGGHHFTSNHFQSMVDHFLAIAMSIWAIWFQLFCRTGAGTSAESAVGSQHGDWEEILCAGFLTVRKWQWSHPRNHQTYWTILDLQDVQWLMLISSRFLAQRVISVSTGSLV